MLMLMKTYGRQEATYLNVPNKSGLPLPNAKTVTPAYKQKASYMSVRVLLSLLC